MMRAVDKENVNLPYMLQDLGGTLAQQGNADGEPMLNEALELFRRRYGEDHITVVETFNRFGIMYEARGELDRAQAMFEQTLARAKRLPEVQATPTTAEALGALGRIHQKKGEYAEAEDLYMEALDLQRKSAGDNQPVFANTLMGFAALHSLMHK
jgi:tetratricopeptide (TPR) repeat protein